MATVGTLKIQATLKDLEGIRDFIEHAAKKIGLPDQATGEIRLAVDEACANILAHGYKGNEGELEILVNHEGQKMIVTVSDKAPKFDPIQNGVEPDFNLPLLERPMGGMGLYLMKLNTDSVEYRSIPSGGNILILTKNF